MAQRGSEKGIKADADYGTAFLDARKGAEGGGGGDAPPPPPPTPAPIPPSSGKSVGQYVLFAVLSLTVIAGGVGLFMLTGGASDSGGDLFTERGGVEIADHDRQTTTSTTERPTTTTSTSTTSTTLPPTSSTQPGPTTTAPSGVTVVPVATTAAPACPGGSVQSGIGGTRNPVVGGKWNIDFAGSMTTNNTNATIKLTLEVPITYVDTGGTTRTVVFRPDEYGQSVAAGATLNWGGQRLIESPQQPTPGQPTGSWAWADPAFASCQVGTFS